MANALMEALSSGAQNELANRLRPRGFGYRSSSNDGLNWPEPRKVLETAQNIPVVGDALSGAMALYDAAKGDYGSAALNALGVLPFMSAGILKKAHLKPGGPEFGQWELNKVERRTRPEEYIDARGENRTKYVADMDNAEQSWGSGQPVANIYWMKDKRTGDVKPFGDDTAHYAMGKESAAYAKKKFSESLEAQQNDWFKQQKQSLGMKWHEGGPEFERIREFLIKGQINEQRALEMMTKQGEKIGFVPNVAVNTPKLTEADLLGNINPQLAGAMGLGSVGAATAATQLPDEYKNNLRSLFGY